MPSSSKFLDHDFSFMGKKFNDPFLLNSNLYIPKDFYTALEFALYLAIKNPIYTQATRRTVSYFITEFAFVGDSGDSRERSMLKEYLTDDLKLLDALQQAGMESFIFGNSFMRINYPFNRYLIDRRNGGYRQYALNMFGDDITFNLKDLTYNVPDPLTAHLPEHQRSRVDLEFIDRKSKDESRISLHFLNPTRIMINMNYISGNCEYIYRFEEFFRAAVEAGQPIHQINDTPMDMLIALSKGQDFVFNPDTIFHFKQPFVSGLSFNGWGIPHILLNYENIHHMQVLRCINEAIGLDYMLPFRLISPAPSGSGGSADATASTNLGRWMAAMSQLIASKRQDPTALHTVPFPVVYQELGANGKALAPVELMTYQQDTILDGFGYPSELWHMSLQTQQMPTAMRLFQTTFMHLPRSFNNAVRWVTRNIQNYMERENIGIKLQMPSVADNLERSAVFMQLTAGGEMSRQTAYKQFGIDNPVDEITRRAKEDIEIQREQIKVQQEFERQQQLGSASQVVDAMLQGQAGPGGVAPVAPGGAPMGGGGGGNVTPLDLEQQAEEQAMQLLQIQDTGERRKIMMQIKASNGTLYALVQRKMEDMRQAGASQGRKSVGQQMAPA